MERRTMSRPPMESSISQTSVEELFQEDEEEKNSCGMQPASSADISDLEENPQAAKQKGVTSVGNSASCGGPQDDQETKKKVHISSLDGVRVVAAAVVIFHHIDILNPSLSTSFGDDEESEERRQLFLGNNNYARERLLTSSVAGHFIGVGPGHIAVQCFLVLCGFVCALPGLKCLEAVRRGSTAIGSSSTSMTSTSSNDLSTEEDERKTKLKAMESFFQKYQRALFKRFWRLALPVIPVQIVHVTLWHFELASGPFGKFPGPRRIKNAYTKGIQSVFTPVLSGVLWVVKDFLVAPFLVAAFLLPGFNLPTNRRIAWYCMVLAYLVGNVYKEKTISGYLGVAIGMVFCDLHLCESTGCEQYRTRMKHPVMQLLLLVIFTLPWFPDPIYAHKFAMILSATAFVLLALYSPLVRCLMDNRLMSWLAPYTYELYIWHPVTLSFFSEAVRPKVESDIALYIIGYTAVLVVTFFAYWVFEKPAMNLTELLYIRFVMNNEDKNAQHDDKEENARNQLDCKQIQ